ncbi:Gp138 family membrane-puncturing spike protein [Phocoenobacter skyensis]|uniref:Gp138 family membrane-puncturing spike protein n=1 Tax=Phocoenobacter skyensis TaxID=97481 RepID=A0ABT9JKJ9_9PAST|nr:Gp138 family membrane-puncturing spike protein [Pasteurella skyensis]MDP8078325.1 Gp138 family membrane-puncturing spike protein [Pasteurella skyensis]MDP8084583.1 Gp138 family membrane-puncturing spike protein [Pasteurella skyensis]
MQNDIHTTLPGKIISWDGEMAIVEPTLPKTLTNGKPLAPPQIISVPVCFPIGGGAIISVPLKAGDDVKLNFCERSLENWLSGNDTAPDDPRRFDLSDCFATPVCRPTQASCDTENLSLSYGGGSFKIAKNGEITIKTPKLTVNGKTILNGDTATTGKLTNNKKDVGSGHKHNGVAKGASNTGEPI